MPKVQISPENKIYDGDGYLLRVACVCVRDNSENEVCVLDLLTPQLWYFNINISFVNLKWQVVDI